MKSHYTAKEIAAAVGLDRSSITRYAKKGNWPHRTKTVLGGREKEYEYLALPDHYRRALLAYELDLSVEFVPPREIPETELKALLSRFQAAPEYNRQRAIARCEILDALAAYHKASGLAVTKAEKGFVELYKIQAAPGISTEIYTTEPKFSVGTLRRWKRQFKASGLAGLLTEYGKKKGRGNAVTPEMRLEIIGQISARPHIRPVRIWEIIKYKFNGNAPDKSTVYRFVNSWKEENHELFTFMKDPSEHKAKYQPAFGDMAADTPWFGHTWEMDSTPADVETLHGRRCTILGSIDIFSRRVVVVVAPTSKSLAVAAVMRKGILAWGVPERIRKDNGKDYVSKHIQAITTGLQIETPKLKPYAGEEKPFIERFFGTMTRELQELLPGYLGHSVAERQEIRERRTWGEKIMKRMPDGSRPKNPVKIPLTMRELQLMIDKWIGVYERRVHGGFKFGKLKGFSPLEASRTGRGPAQFKYDERLLDILLADGGVRTVNKKGIFYDGGKYCAEELIEYMKCQVAIRRDLEDAGTIYVFNIDTGDFICKAIDAGIKGQTLESYMEAKNRHKKALKSKARALEDLTKYTQDPVTVVLDTGETINPATGEVLEETEAAAVLPYTPKADTPAIREAQKALEPLEKVSGQAGESEGPAEVIDLAERRGRDSDSVDDWEPPGAEHPIWDNPIEAYEMFETRLKGFGLKPSHREHMKHLLKIHDWLEDYLESRAATDAI